MQVSEAIGREAIFFLYAIGEGVGLVLLYDVFRIFRRIIRHGNVWVGLEDSVYWVLCTIAVFLLLYQKNDGMMRAFAFMGIVLGMAIYYFLFSRFVVKLCVLVFGGIYKGMRKFLRYILGPFIKFGKKILLFIKKQLKKLRKAIKMGLCKL